MYPPMSATVDTGKILRYGPAPITYTCAHCGSLIEPNPSTISVEIKEPSFYDVGDNVRMGRGPIRTAGWRVKYHECTLCAEKNMISREELTEVASPCQCIVV